MADPYIAKMIESDLTGQIGKKKQKEKNCSYTIIAVILFFLQI